MAIHSSIPSWRIPQTEEPGGLQSMRVAYSPWCRKRVGHDLATKTTTDTVRMLRLKKFAALMSFMYLIRVYSQKECLV